MMHILLTAVNLAALLPLLAVTACTSREPGTGRNHEKEWVDAIWQPCREDPGHRRR